MMNSPHDPSWQSKCITPAPSELPQGARLRWLPMLALTLAYFACAQLSLSLATWHFFAAPIWPAAGIALYGMLAYGRSYWLAIWLGAFASNILSRGWLAGIHLSPAVEGLSALLAVGAAIQAIVGVKMLRPLIEAAEPLEERKDVLRCLLIGGPLSCLISATVGIGSLYLYHQLPREEVLSAWIIWWAGDTLGVLLVVPVLLPFIPALHKTWHRRLLPIAAPTLVTIALVVIGYIWLERAEHSEWNAHLATASEGVRNQLTMLVARQPQRVQAVRDLFLVNGEVDRNQFERFCQYSLNLDGLHALGWAPRVAQADRSVVEAVARRDGVRGYTFRERSENGHLEPEGVRSEYFPLLYIAQVTNMSSAMGFDLGSEPTSRAAMEQASALAKPIWAERFAFYNQDASRKDDWRLFVPVYRSGFDERKATPIERRAALRGFVVGVFYLGDIFSQGQELSRKLNVAYRITTGTGDFNASRELFDNRPVSLRNEPPTWSFTGDPLILQVWSLSPWSPEHSVPILLYLAGSVLATLFVEAFLLAAAGQNVRITRRVEEGISQLRTNESLLTRVMAASQFGYWEWDLTTGLSIYNDRRYTMFGYEPGELTGHYSEWLEMVHPDDRGRVDTQLNDYVAGRIDCYRAEYRMRTKSGMWRWILDTGSITVRDDEGRPLFMSGVYADIHKRKLAEQALRAGREQLRELTAHLESLVEKRTAALAESERFTRAVLDALSARIAVVDQSGFVLATNRAWRIFGNQDSDASLRVVEGENYLNACYQAGTEWATIATLIQDVINGARAEACYEYSCLVAQQQCWYQCWITRFPGEGSVRVVLAHENISARKLAEQASHDITRDLNATLHAIPDLLLELDENGVYWQVWASKKTLLASAQKKLLGRSVREVLPPEAAQVVFEALQEALITGLSHGHQIELPLSRGMRWFELSVAVKEGDTSNLRRFIVLSRDITEHKVAGEALRRLNNELESLVTERTTALEMANSALVENAEKTRSVIEYLVDCVITTNERGTILSANRALEHIFGYSVEEVIGQNISLLMPDSIAREHHKYIGNYLRAGQAKVIGIGSQFEGRHKEGQPIQLEVAVSEYVVQGQRYFTGILRDISAQLRIMNELEQARHDAEQANQAKSAFLATMSHEIRTPMNGVIGMIEVLQQTSLKAHQQEMVELIRDSALALLGIIEDILDFSKIEAGKLEIETIPVAVCSVMEEVCSLLDHVADKHGVELTLFTDPALPRYILSDPLRLRQVVINLTNNAIKFSAGLERPGQVSVRTLLVEDDTRHHWVEIRVTDNGIGMDQETQSRLFHAFTQADASTTRRFGGTGLGLAISYQLVQLMEGQIIVHSEKDKGSMFSVRLPFHPMTVADEREEPNLSDIPCLVIGMQESMAGDLAAYLEAANAHVERVADLTRTHKCSTIPTAGTWVWVIDSGNESPTVDALRAISHAWADLDIHFVVIERGRRRRPRMETADLIRVDGNVLTRRTFLYAVALAIGQGQQEVFEQPRILHTQTKPILPSRQEALRHGRLILVAEDNETNQKVILHQLALLGYAADVAGNGCAALERWQSGDYGLLLTDLHMPEMDGYELARAIRRLEQGKRPIPIIALTANTRKGEEIRCQEAGMNNYLSKPTQLASLHDMLDKWLTPLDEHSPAIAAEHTGEQSATNPSQPVDVSVLAQLVGDDPDIIHDFLQDFRASAAKGLMELLDADASQELLKVGSVAHRLKSSSRSVGAMSLGELCAELEEAARADEMKVVSTLINRFETEMADVQAYIDVLLSQSST